MTIKEIQTALAARNLYAGKIDGDAGPETIRGLRAFQRLAGLVPDGIAGPNTQKALQEGNLPYRNAPDIPPWLVLARADIGVHEGIGAANNPVVVKFFADAGFPGIKTDSTAWCAAFTGAILRRAGIEPQHSLAARSYETWGVGLVKPVLGCIGVKKRKGAGWQGHVGFVEAASPKRIVLVGGNTSDGVNLGDFDRSEFTAFRWPEGVPIPTNSVLPTTLAEAKRNASEA